MPTPGDMVLIPKGSVFYSDPTQRPGLVRDDYYIDVFPVTNEHYHSFLVDHPETVEVPNLEYVSGGADRWDKRTRTFPAGKGDHPVVILGSNCRAFCAWRSQQDKEGKQYSLPNRNEWLRAAGADGRMYPWGDQLDEVDGNATTGSSHSVRQYPARVSKYGLWYGNAWELTRCARVFGVFSDRWRFDDPPWDAHSTDVKDDEIGFRCVARLPKQFAAVIRSECVTVSFDEGRSTYGLEWLTRRDFSDLRRPSLHVQKPFGDFVGDVIVDTDTGLIWEISGSETRLTHEGAYRHVSKLNSGWFAGYDDWRLPTIPELASLLRQASSSGGYCIDPIFEKTQLSYWSGDRCSPDYSWYVNFVAPDVDTL